MSSSSLTNLYCIIPAASIAEIITLPICTLKTNHINTESKSIMNTMRNIYSIGGIKAYYRASIPATMTQVFSSTSKFVLYKYFNTISRYTVLNIVAAGILTSLVTHPLDAIKIYKQMGNVFLDDLMIVGPKLFYRGYSKSFVKTCVGSALFFPLNDFAKSKTNSTFCGCMISAIISTSIMHPIDYLKTRHISGSPLYLGFHHRIYYK